MVRWDVLQPILQCFLLLVVCLWAMVTDLKFHKIKNSTVLLGMVGGLLINHRDLYSALLGFLLPLTLIVLFVLKMMGAGDVKLLAAVGAIVGFPDNVSVLLYSLTFCGVQILFTALRQGRFLKLWKEIYLDFKILFWTHTLCFEKGHERIPMACSIAASSILWIAGRLTQR